MLTTTQQQTDLKTNLKMWKKDPFKPFPTSLAIFVEETLKEVRASERMISLFNSNGKVRFSDGEILGENIHKDYFYGEKGVAYNFDDLAYPDKILFVQTLINFKKYESKK